ncbi:MAG: endonuclease Q family protein [Patescibacteria group bacterium]|nr:endonuclease Q family protein [Patescibacteria group bacterium]
MRFFADLHFHSKYSRACSKDLDLEHLVYWSKLKGLNLIATADFTHPFWFHELRTKLEEDGSGFLRLKKEYQIDSQIEKEIFFVPSVEISSIFSRAGQVKRMHYLVILPDLDSVEKFNQKLSFRGNLRSDGRPILGLEPKAVLELGLSVNPKMIFIPAHIWTPWFSLFGSMSGFNSINEAFGDLTQFIPAIETGLSSDPEMNWRLSQLDPFQIVSSSDAHSPQPHRIGREATVFELEKPNYASLFQALKNPNEKNRIELTIEFYPEEGKYHYDGHRSCQISFSPEESKRNNFLCPICAKKLTIGVLSRVEELADRPSGYIGLNRPPAKHLIPLSEIIAEALKSGPTTKKVLDLYLTIVNHFENEFNLFLGDADINEIKNKIPEPVWLGLNKFKKGELKIKPGYDGVYGEIKILDLDEAESKKTAEWPKSLF